MDLTRHNEKFPADIIYFEGSFKGFMVQIGIIAVIFY